MSSQQFESTILVCCECGEEFAFTADAQQYFADRGVTLKPTLCKPCHVQAKRVVRFVNVTPNAGSHRAAH